MSNQLLRFKPKQRYLVLDEETESLSLCLARPWQSTATICEGDKIIKEIDDYILWNNLEVCAEAAAITRYNDWTVRTKGISPEQAWNNLEPYLYNEDYLIIGSNLFNFDIYIINTWRLELGLETDYSFLTRIIDLQPIFKAYQKGIREIPSDPMKRLIFQYKWANYRERGLKSSVQFMCQQLGVPYDKENAHSSLVDNRMAFAQWNKLKWLVDI